MTHWITQGSQVLRSFNYTSLSRLKDATNPESGTFTFTYDENGNVKTKTDPRFIPNTSTHRIITYAYDPLGRITSQTYNDGTPNVTFAYDAPGVLFAKGRPASVTSSVSSYTFLEYDPLGQVKSAKQTTDGQDYTMSYAYNKAGTLVSQTYPSGRVVATDYDDAGRIAGVKNGTTQAYYVGAVASDTTNRLQYSAAGSVQVRKWPWVCLIAFVSEVYAIRWRWEAAPTDQLRAWYQGSFGTYFVESITPWLIAFSVLTALWLLIGKSKIGQKELNLARAQRRDEPR